MLRRNFFKAIGVAIATVAIAKDIEIDKHENIVGIDYANGKDESLVSYTNGNHDDMLEALSRDYQLAYDKQILQSMKHNSLFKEFSK